jgi:hypothetical protein
VGDFQAISISCLLLMLSLWHVGNALALSIMSTAMLHDRVVEFSTRRCRAHD